MKPLSRLFAFFATIVIALMVIASDARAGERVTPRDVPTGNATLHVPALPSDLEVFESGYLRIAYPASVKERVQPLIDDAEGAKSRLIEELGSNVLDKLEVRIARSPEDMTALAPTEAPPPQYATGVAYSSVHLVLLSLRAPKTAEAPDLLEVFRHELAHVALHDAVNGHHVPVWFNEGFAIHFSGEESFQRTRTLWDATLSGTVIPLSDLDASFPDENYEVSIAYAESADFVRFLLRGSDRARFASLAQRVRDGSTFDRAISDAYGTDTRKLEYEWREDLEKRFSVWPVILGGSALWVLMVFILVLAYVKRRRKAKATLARWAEEEAAEDARVRQLAAIPVVAEEEPPAVVVRMPSDVPRVEHDGRWHTLH